MAIKIEVPESKTEIVFNVAGKSARQAAEEIGMFAYMLKTMTELSGDDDGWTWYCESEEAAHKVTLPLGEHLRHSEWDDYGRTFESNSIITGYTVTGKDISVNVLPGFIGFAKTGRPFEEYCRARLNEFKELMED